MKREIKFKAWNIKEQKMQVVDEINHIASRSDLWMIWVNWITDTIGIQGWSHNDCILMQYTWLKDKNWVEIYEGDVIKTENWELWYSVREKYPLYPQFVKIWDEAIKTYICIKACANSEVVRNIHENPELIGE